MSSASSFHKIFVVATPIGHLDDLSARAIEVLRAVPVIAAEDTRNSRPMLERIGSKAKLIALHEHNEVAGVQMLAQHLQSADVALISDAGTPGISDPGAKLIAGLRALGVQAVPIPGPSAVTTLLSVAGLAEGKFRFEGFLPTKPAARQERLKTLAQEDCVVVLFEAPHRMEALAQDMQICLAPHRSLVVGRELTKKFEQIVSIKASEIVSWLQSDANHLRGEFVIALAPAEKLAPSETDKALDKHLPVDTQMLLQALAEGFTPRQAAKWAGKITGLKDIDWYAELQKHKTTSAN